MERKGIPSQWNGMSRESTRHQVAPRVKGGPGLIREEAEDSQLSYQLNFVAKKNGGPERLSKMPRTHS